MDKPKVYSVYSRAEGKLEDIEQTVIPEEKELLQIHIKDQLVETGEDPDQFYFEYVVRQQYNNGDKTQTFDDPIFKENIPFVTIAINAIRK